MDSTQEADWQHVVDLIRSRWPSSYSEDGERAPMPKSVGEIFRQHETAAVLWAITPSSGIVINCHFFTTEEIEFDLDPKEILGQPQLDAVADFVEAIAHATEKLAIVCYENSPETAFMWFDPAADTFGVSAGDA
jgi:hypothetical protein